jgi:hypothetical protein
LTKATPHGLERLELRIERLQITFRFTFAFHAREVRFECDRGDGFERLFPETFSFHAARHDPMELFLQLDDLLRKPQLLSPRANRRDAVDLVTRMFSGAVQYLERVCSRLESEGRLGDIARLRFHQDVALLTQIMMRFVESRELVEGRQVRVAGFLLRKLMFRSLMVLTYGRVTPSYLQDYMAGDVDPVDPSDDPSESGFSRVMEGDDQEAVNRLVVRMAEQAFYAWLEGVCLDEENQAFEKEDSPFADRETEVMRAITRKGCSDIERGQDLIVFMRRRSKDCRRILEKLESWFLRRYDIRHSSSIIHHTRAIDRGEDDARVTLSWHTPRNHALALGALLAPFVAAAFGYARHPFVFDLVCSAEVLLINAVAVWFLLYRFCWKRDLSFFHASVPRIAAGIIVGYLPVFLIDEVWSLASRSAATLTSVATLLGLVTLLYIYVEVQRRLGDSVVAFARARAIFLLGVLEAFGFGVVMTSMTGSLMVSRNWSPQLAELPVEVLRQSIPPLVGDLPRIIGVEPLYAFPSALLMMTFLSFFIGVFLQLMWEELPITEPL